MAKLLVEPIEKYGLSKKHAIKTLFSKIGIIGCGKEGQNIARIASFSGMEVVFIELSEEKIKNALDKISIELDQQIESWGLTHTEKKLILSRIKGSLDYNDLSDCDFVIEAIRSDKVRLDSIETRKQIFKKIEKAVRPDTIIATNATTIVISELAAELEHKERSVSLHFFATSQEARIIEVVKGLYTSDEVYERVKTFVNLINRSVVPVEESSGLISVRLFVVLLNEACEILMESVSSMHNIDKTMEVGLGMRFGPFYTADIIGLDKVMRWMDNLYNEFGDKKYIPSPIIRRKVRAKQLGMKVGKGFYEYDENGKRILSN